MSAEVLSQNGIPIEVSLGDLVDRLTILRIKAERAADPQIRKFATDRAETLSLALSGRVFSDASARAKHEQVLHDLNSALWDAENAIRAHIAAQNFGSEFQEVACRIPRLNDERARVKADLDALSGWFCTDQKSYAAPEDDMEHEQRISDLVTCEFGRMLVPTGDIYVGQSLIRYGQYSPDEKALLDAVLRKGDAVVEAGAHIGALTVPLAQKVGETGRVYCFEPQRVLFQMLCGNLALNGLGNCEAWPVALGASVTEMTVPLQDYRVEGNYGGLALATAGPGEHVPVTTIDNLHLPECRLIKADVQGMEAEVLEGARETIARCAPFLYIENDQRERSAHLLETLAELGYDCYWHLPTLFAAENFRGETENVFPGIVSVNLLCMPKGEAPPCAELRRVSGPDDWWMP